MDVEDEVLEYLDFYYDDDPTLMNARNGIEKSPSRRKRKAADVAQGNKKRKVKATNDAKETKDDAVNAKWRGIIWKVEDDKSKPPYEPGKEGVVALLKDWRILFETPSKENSKRAGKPKLAVKGREVKDKSSREPSETPDVDNPTHAPQPANGPRARRSRRSPKPSPLKNSVSSSDIPSKNANGPRKRSRLSPSEDATEDEAETTPSTKKRKPPDDEEKGKVSAKRRVGGRKTNNDTPLKVASGGRQTRSRKAAGS
jgi:hypothetical protein